jgi:hypothetical protein
MNLLLYFALWAGGCGAHVMGHGHAEHEEHRAERLVPCAGPRPKSTSIRFAA